MENYRDTIREAVNFEEPTEYEEHPEEMEYEPYIEEPYYEDQPSLIFEIIDSSINDFLRDFIKEVEGMERVIPRLSKKISGLDQRLSSIEMILDKLQLKVIVKAFSKENEITGLLQEMKDFNSSIQPEKV